MRVRDYITNVVLPEANAPYQNVEVVCSDASEHRKRVETREKPVPGLRLPTWAEVVSREYHEWAIERIVIDTSRRPEGECLEELLSKLHAK